MYDNTSPRIDNEAPFRNIIDYKKKEGTMKYHCSATALARYIVQKCYIDKRPISNLQLQKILYFLQIMYGRSTHGTELLFRDEFEAWPYGPVIFAVYDEFSRYGGSVIEATFNEPDPCSQEVMAFIDQTVTFLREKTPWELVEISHAQGSPWDLTYQGGKGRKKAIPQQYIINAISER